jgi:tetratricopeptide (TPR) repeat protein
MMPKIQHVMVAALLWSVSAWVTGAAAADLTLDIRPIKPSFLLAEPVHIDLSLRNVGSQAVEARPELALETQSVSLSIARDSGPFEPFRPAAHREPSRMPQTLRPSQALVHRQLLLYNSLTHDLAFPVAGRYRLRALRHGFGIEPDLESSVIEISIAQPSGAEAEALPLFRTRKVVDLIIDLDESEEAVRNLEQLMSRYGATTYGKYAQFYLARRQAREFFGRKPSFGQAAKLYQDLVRRDPQFPLVTEANYGLGMALARTEQYVPAREAFQSVLKGTPDSVLQQGAERQLERISVELREKPPAKPPQ